MTPPAPRRGLLRYALVGAAATGVHYALLVALVEAGDWPAWWAAGAGALAGAQVAYLGNRAYTFAHRGDMRRSWPRFQATAVLGALLSIALVKAGDRLGLHYLASQVIATGVAMLLTYGINRRWTFAATRGPG